MEYTQECIKGILGEQHISSCDIIKNEIKKEYDYYLPKDISVGFVNTALSRNMFGRIEIASAEVLNARKRFYKLVLMIDDLATNYNPSVNLNELFRELEINACNVQSYAFSDITSVDNIKQKMSILVVCKLSEEA